MADNFAPVSWPFIPVFIELSISIILSFRPAVANSPAVDSPSAEDFLSIILVEPRRIRNCAMTGMARSFPWQSSQLISSCSSSFFKSFAFRFWAASG